MPKPDRLDLVSVVIFGRKVSCHGGEIAGDYLTVYLDIGGNSPCDLFKIEREFFKFGISQPLDRGTKIG